MGCESHLARYSSTLEEMLAGVDAALLASGTMQPGQQVVLVCGYPVAPKRAPNMALLHTVGSEATVGGAWPAIWQKEMFVKNNFEVS